jgi:hypothetical protein
MRRFASFARSKPITTPPATSTTTSAPTPTSVSSQSTLSPVDMFKRGIKRDLSVYPVLKDELYKNDNWHNSFTNQARAQDVSDVLDAAYSPVAPAEIDLFQEKQKYLYAVLESKVETAKGKAIISKHEKAFDSQKTYAELQEHHLKSKHHLVQLRS